MKRLFTHNLNYKETLKKFLYNLKRLCSIALVERGRNALNVNLGFTTMKEVF